VKENSLLRPARPCIVPILLQGLKGPLQSATTLCYRKVFIYYKVKMPVSKNHLILGFIIGTLFFCFFENSPGQAFSDKCWVRRQGGWIRHTKVYLLGGMLIYASTTCNQCPPLQKAIALLAGIWIGVHGAQDIAERIHERNKRLV